MIEPPEPLRFLIACDNNGHHWLLFNRKDALASGDYAEVVKARDHLNKGGKK
jgi:hypothetical protein